LENCDGAQSSRPVRSLYFSSNHARHSVSNTSAEACSPLQADHRSQYSKCGVFFLPRAHVYHPCGVLPTLNFASPYSRPFLVDSSPPQGPDFCVGNSHQKTSPVCPLVTCVTSIATPTWYYFFFLSSTLAYARGRIFRAPVFQGNGLRLKAVIVPPR
jgi:hypothetical protein